jgi:DNA-binding NtrC family response regulator
MQAMFHRYNESVRDLMTDQTTLVVDDDPKIRNLLRNVLEDDGFGVIEAETATRVVGD